jgi:hypothetical protein
MENEEIRHQIQGLLQKGHIRPNSSPCRISIVLVQKKDGTWRLFIDYRSLNKIKPTNVWKTTSKSIEGLFEWLVMPFGLTNAPPTFMRLMDDVLRPFTNSFVVVYLDEILMFNRTWEDHMWHIQQVLSTLRQHKIYANLEKCPFWHEQGPIIRLHC